MTSESDAEFAKKALRKAYSDGFEDGSADVNESMEETYARGFKEGRFSAGRLLHHRLHTASCVKCGYSVESLFAPRKVWSLFLEHKCEDNQPANEESDS